MSYNGWSNYETWCAALWLDNCEGSQEWALEQARECVTEAPEQRMVRDGILTADQQACGDLAEILRDEHEQGMPDIGCSVYSDLLQSAVSEIDWREIAEGYIEQAGELAEAS